MPARDPLAVLARLRRVETDQARRRLGERIARSAAAEVRVQAAQDAFAREGAVADQPSDYGAWLVRGLAERARATLALDLERRAEAEARQALTDARGAGRAVERLAADRARTDARDAGRTAQARIDDIMAARR